MTAAHLADEVSVFPAAASRDPVDIDVPVVDTTADESAATPVGPPPAELDETAQLLAASQAHNTALQSENAELKAKVAQLEAPQDEEWKPLKAACTPPLDYEWTRKRVGLGVFKARRALTPRGKLGRIFVEVNSVRAYWHANAK